MTRVFQVETRSDLTTAEGEGVEGREKRGTRGCPVKTRSANGKGKKGARKESGNGATSALDSGLNIDLEG